MAVRCHVPQVLSSTKVRSSPEEREVEGPDMGGSTKMLRGRPFVGAYNSYPPQPHVGPHFAQFWHRYTDRGLGVVLTFDVTTARMITMDNTVQCS